MLDLYVPSLGRFINYNNEKRFLENMIATGSRGQRTWAKGQLAEYDRLNRTTPTTTNTNAPTHTNTGTFPSAGETGTPSHVTPPKTDGIGQYMSLIVIGAIILLLKK
jgi:hypothetical protein